ncbi:phosphate acetyltransferase [Candidatus Woesearchaeota archaeon]|nr:phosphate acetyltransferase [Candidatus Woesearchaeota archaeon]
MKDFIKKIKDKARKNPKRIVFPEGEEERTLKATKAIVKEGIAKVILLGNEEIISKKVKKLGIDLKKIKIINPAKSKEQKKYAKEFFKLRKKKGVDIKEAQETIKNDCYYGTMMVHLGDADGLVSGAIHSTADTIRPALQIIGTKKKFARVSGVFFLMLPDKRLLFFADAAVEIEPDAKDLAEVAIDTAETAKKFGVEPKVALLSFSTHGSARHPLVDKVREATEIVKYQKPKLIVDGEIQLDAAVDKDVYKIKCPNSVLKGEANVLIFPDLQSANISYKLVERLAGARAVGPVLQGLKKPVNDLSRGCDAEDIVDITAITVVEAQKKE